MNTTIYKSKLQELCQKQKWALPTYTVGCADGPDHSPRFLAFVTVNGIKFDAVDSATSSKEAQNKVAQMAFDHFAPTLPPPPPPGFAWLKCNRDVIDCADVLTDGRIKSDGGHEFGAPRIYARLSLIKTNDDFDQLIEKLTILVGKGPSTSMGRMIS